MIFKKYWLAGLLIIAVGAGSFYFYATYQSNNVLNNKPEDRNQVSTTTVAKSEATTDELAKKNLASLDKAFADRAGYTYYEDGFYYTPYASQPNKIDSTDPRTVTWIGGELFKINNKFYKLDGREGFVQIGSTASPNIVYVGADADISARLHYYKDANAVYSIGFSGNNLQLVLEVKPESFAILSNGYIKDASAIYRFDGLENKYVKMNEIDPVSFKVFAGNNDSDEFYMLDKSAVYFKREKIEGADPKTFEIIKGSLKPGWGGIWYLYAKDGQHVYYEGKIVLGANPHTFKVIENGNFKHSYGADGVRVYFQDSQITGSDPQTFKALWQPIYEGCGTSSYSKDAKQVYYDDLASGSSTLVSGADPQTFESLINLGKDKKGYYKKSQFIGPTVDPKELVCNYG